MRCKHIKPMGKVSLCLPVTHAHVDMPTDDWQNTSANFQAPHTHKTSLVSRDTEAIKYLATIFKTLQARSY